LLVKDVKFHLDEDFLKAFQLLKEKLITTFAIVAPNWNQDFELMCDASGCAMGAISG